MPLLSETANLDSYGATELLWNTYQPYSMWLIFALIGLASLIILVIYNRVTQDAAKNPDHPFNRHGHAWVLCFLIPIAITFIVCTCMFYSLALLLNSIFFFSMLIISFLPKHLRTLDLGEPK
jgi:magnesium-transporting ATPase (P-type)